MSDNNVNTTQTSRSAVSNLGLHFLSYLPITILGENMVYSVHRRICASFSYLIPLVFDEFFYLFLWAGPYLIDGTSDLFLLL